jgi:bifunctional non-homologous end joining protein LigD
MKAQFTHTDKILFPKVKVTKGQLIDYYDQVADLILPHLKGRPLTLYRFPDGVGHEGFYQQNPQDYYPAWLGSLKVDRGTGKPNVAITCGTRRALLYFANLATISFHPWLSRGRYLRRPDKLIIDLDPPGKNFKAAVKLAQVVRKLFQEKGMDPLVMTTGGNGLHVVQPIRQELEYEQVKAFAALLADLICDRAPDLATREARKVKRRGRIYLDIFRINYGQSAVSPYSVRAYPTAPIATPVSWQELSRLSSAQEFNILNIQRRLDRISVWEDYEQHRCSIKRLAK